MSESDYQSALKLLYDRINYERSSHAPYTAQNYRLDRMRALLEDLNNPQKNYDIIHIAGTKGKGTTAHLIYDALRINGRSVGLYTSPHLLKLEERFQSCGVVCSPNELVSLIEEVLPAALRVENEGLGKPTFFELTTAIGLLHFAKKKNDSVVLEVGLGGRLDSTNICRPMLTIITSISLDHQAQLGSTIAEIAAEKAGIIKPGVAVISTARHPDARAVIQATAKACGSQLFFIDRDFTISWAATGDLAKADVSGGVARATYKTESPQLQSVFGDAPWTMSVLGQHQSDNLAGAVSALNWLSNQAGWKIDSLKTRQAIAQSQVAGRLQIVGRNPIRIIDTAHNPASVSAGMQAIRAHFGEAPLRVVFASSRDKDFRTMLETILPECQAIYCTAFLKNPRAVSPADLTMTAQQVAGELNSSQPESSAMHQQGRRRSKIYTFDNPVEAWQAATSQCPADGITLAIGSFFLAAELIEATH